MKKIRLSQGKVALVDNQDFEELNRHKWSAHKIAGIFYAVRVVAKRGNQKAIYMHRAIVNAPPGVECGHRNHNRLDNRRKNLRFCTHAQTKMNQRSRKGGTSTFKGVSFHKATKKWRAKIWLKGKRRHLGLFINERDAARAYDDAAREHFGEFARTNFAAWDLRSLCIRAYSWLKGLLF